MRFSTIVSLLLAVILATAAAYGARGWLAEQQQIAFESVARQNAAAQAPVEEAPKETLVVASEPVAFGELIQPSILREIEWFGSIRPDGSFQKIQDVYIGDSEDVARYALTQIAPGEAVLGSKITAPGQRAKLSTALTPGKKAVSIRVNDVLGVAGFVLPGDHVDVMLTRGGFVDVLLQGVRVLAIDQLADQRAENPSVVRTVTFEVSTEEAQKLVLGSTVGTLSLALRNISSTDIESNERITIEDLSDPAVTEALLNAALEEQDPEAEEGPDRIAELEALLKNLTDGVSVKLDELEDKINTPEPVTVSEKETPVVIPSIIEQRATVGVIRNGQKVEYKVDVSEEEDASEESEQPD